MATRSVKARQHHMIPLEKMVAESITFIQQYEPKEEGGYFVGFSGGKDSIVSLELVRMAGVKHTAYYSATGIDTPEIVSFIRKHYPDVIWLHPANTFWKLIKIKSPPLRTTRWCCDHLKKFPSRHIPLKHRIMGIRAEESYKRSKRPIIDPFGKNQIIYKPIFYWKEWHVWEFIDSNHLAYPSLYDEGFARIGCVVCPFIDGPKLRQNKARWPMFYKVFERTVREWWKTKHNKVSSPMIKRLDIQSADDYLEFWYGAKRFRRPKCTCPMHDCAGAGKGT